MMLILPITALSLGAFWSLRRTCIHGFLYCTLTAFALGLATFAALEIVLELGTQPEKLALRFLPIRLPQVLLYSSPFALLSFVGAAITFGVHRRFRARSA